MLGINARKGWTCQKMLEKLDNAKKAIQCQKMLENARKARKCQKMLENVRKC